MILHYTWNSGTGGVKKEPSAVSAAPLERLMTPAPRGGDAERHPRGVAPD